MIGLSNRVKEYPPNTCTLGISCARCRHAAAEDQQYKQDPDAIGEILGRWAWLLAIAGWEPEEWQQVAKLS